MYACINLQTSAVGVLQLKPEHRVLHPNLFSLLSVLLHLATSRRYSIQLSRVGLALYTLQRLRRTSTASEHLLFHQGAGVGT